MSNKKILSYACFATVLYLSSLVIYKQKYECYCQYEHYTIQCIVVDKQEVDDKYYLIVDGNNTQYELNVSETTYEEFSIGDEYLMDMFEKVCVYPTSFDSSQVRVSD